MRASQPKSNHGKIGLPGKSHKSLARASPSQIMILFKPKEWKDQGDPRFLPVLTASLFIKLADFWDYSVNRRVLHIIFILRWRNIFCSIGSNSTDVFLKFLIGVSKEIYKIFHVVICNFITGLNGILEKNSLSLKCVLIFTSESNVKTRYFPVQRKQQEHLWSLLSKLFLCFLSSKQRPLQHQEEKWKADLVWKVLRVT